MGLKSWINEPLAKPPKLSINIALKAPEGVFSIRKQRFCKNLSILILAVPVLGAGFLMLHEPVPASSDIKIDALTLPATTHQGQDLANTGSTPYLSTPTAVISPCMYSA